jgi:hypothetical protein
VFFKYIQPCSPVLAKAVPAGDDWQHEIKFDGFRVQAHIIGKTVELYSRSGSRFSRRFPRLVEVLGELPTRSAIIDGEIVASDAAGMPDFWPLFLRSAKPTKLQVWALDLLALDGKDLRKLPLERRQRRLQALLNRFGCPVVLASEPSRTARPCFRWPRSTGWKAWSRSAEMRHIGRVRAEAGARSRRSRGVRPTGSDGDCSNAVSNRQPQLPPHLARGVTGGHLHNRAIFQVPNVRITAFASLILATSAALGSPSKILLIRVDA